MVEAARGPEHPDTATSLNNLANLLYSQGDYAAARPYFERALAIREKVLGPEQPDTARSLNDLAVLLKAQGDTAAARPYLERALAIYEKTRGPEHPGTATSLNNLAACSGPGDRGGAATSSALGSAKGARGRTPRYCDEPEQLGGLLYAQGDYAAAHPSSSARSRFARRCRARAPRYRSEPEQPPSCSTYGALRGGALPRARDLRRVSGPEHLIPRRA